MLEELRRRKEDIAPAARRVGQPRARAQLEWKAAAGRSVLGERTNAQTSMSNQRSVMPPYPPGVPPGYSHDPPTRVISPHHPSTPSSVPPPKRFDRQRPLHTPCLDRPPGVPRRTGERRPLLGYTGTASLGHIPTTNSWFSDIESQWQNAAQWVGWYVYRTNVPSRRRARLGCGCCVSATIWLILVLRVPVVLISVRSEPS